MLCPQCNTDNRDERATCYHCEQDLSMLRVVVNRAKNHYNNALEHAERDRLDEAIAELKHALELDSGFVSAWIVLGTLHARKEMFDEAREAWNRALALNPHLKKAHDYLDKSGSVARAVPTVRRLTLLSTGLLATVLTLAVALVAIVFYFRRPDPGLTKIDRVIELTAQNRIGEAIDILEETSGSVLTSGASRRHARFMKEQLEGRISARLREASELAKAGSLEAALEALTEVEAGLPPETAAAECRRIHSIIARSAALAAGKEVARWESGEIDFAELGARLEHLCSLCESDAEGDRITAMLATARESFNERECARLKATIVKAEDLRTMAARIAEAGGAAPSCREMFESILTSRLEAEAARAQAVFDSSLGRDDPTAARGAIDQIRDLYADAGRRAPTELMETLDARVRSVASGRRFAEVSALFERGAFEELIEATAELKASDWTPGQLIELKSQRNEAIRQFVAELWHWSESLDGKFESVAVTREQAMRMARHFDLAIRNTRTEEAYRKPRLLFRAASAHLKLGDVEEAGKLIRRLEADYPTSNLWNRFTRKVQQRIEDELAGNSS